MKSLAARVALSALMVGVSLVAACDFHPASWKTANMTPPSDRLKIVLANLKPHCFGRFTIDLPEGTTVAWGQAMGLEILPGRVGEVDQRVKAKEDERKAKERFPLTEHLGLYFETRAGPLPHLQHVISQRDFDSEGFVQIDSYFSVADALVVVESQAMDADKAIANIEDLARRLRLRREDEIPTDAGQCIENGFVADRPDAGKEGDVDFIQVGYRLKDFPDVHLSIDLQPANEESAKPGLAKRLADSEADARKRLDFNLYGDLTTFRRAPRAVHDWYDGFEFLTKTPNTKESKAHHDFWVIFQGQIGQLYYPYADIRMSSGIKKNTSGTAEPSITDEEAIALWDALMSTIRVRPVKAKTAAAALEPPIGTRALTGEACPRDGVWRCADESTPVEGGRQRRFRNGETLPPAVLLGQASLLQRLKGRTPTHASPTVWTLVSTDATDAPR